MLTALFALALQSAAMPPAPVCSATVAPPVGLSAWSRPVDLRDRAGFVVGTAQEVALSPIDAVKLPMSPSRSPTPGTFGGAFDFVVEKPGTYRVALSTGAWIDLIGNGKSLVSVAHMEGPACSGIRKIVDFTLTPGRYVLQLSGAKIAHARVLIAIK